LLGLLLRPGLKLGDERRLVFLEQALLGGLQMRVARAAEPDIELRIRFLGGDLRERLARSLERHRDLDAGFLLERHGGGIAPLGCTGQMTLSWFCAWTGATTSADAMTAAAAAAAKVLVGGNH
jgi:hypothetical protein